MATRTFDSLVNAVSPNVPGCPYPLILKHVRDSAIRTCERTLYWRHAEAPYALSAGVPEYAYRKPVDADVHAVFMATVNGNPLDKLTLDQAIDQYPIWADLYGGVPYEQLWSGSGSFNEDPLNEDVFNGGPTFTLTDEALENASEPRIITQVTPDKFIVLPLPDDTKQYVLRLIYALKPKRTATSMPSYICDELEEAIVHGALQELLVMPNASWTDRELATYHAKQYTFKIAERRARANLGNVRGTMTAKMQPFM